MKQNRFCTQYRFQFNSWKSLSDYFATLEDYLNGWLPPARRFKETLEPIKIETGTIISRKFHEELWERVTVINLELNIKTLSKK